MKGKLSRERYKAVTNTEKLSRSLLTFVVNTPEFSMVFGKHRKQEKH